MCHINKIYLDVKEKKMRKISQVACLILALFMIIGLSSCQRDAETPSPSTASPTQPSSDKPAPSSAEPTDDEEFMNTMPISDELVTVSAWRSWSSTFHTDPNEIPANQEIEKRTNVHINFICAPTQSAQESFGIMLAGNDYTDIIYAHAYGSEPQYIGGVDKAIEDAVYVDITDYLHLAPNYRARLDASVKAQKQSKTDSGAYYFPAIQSGEQPAWYGSMVRADWLEDAGLDEPVTISDWYNMLTAFKNNGHNNPLFIASSGYDLMGFGIIGAFNAPPTFFNKDGVVHFGAIEDGYKEYLDTLAKWYSEGLINQDFSTYTSWGDQSNLFTQDKVGAADGAVYSSAMNYPFLHGGEGVKWEAVPLPVLNKGDMGHFRRVNEIVGTAAVFPTTASIENGNFEIVMRLIDYSFSEEGAAILNYGVEGLTWEWGDDNLPHFTDFYLNNDEYQVADMRTIYTDSNGRGGYYMWIRENESYPKEVIDGQFKWMDSSLGDWVMPPVTLTSDEAEEYSRYYSDIKTFVDEYTLGVIMGNRTTDDWDNFVAELKNLNVERCIELYQNALNRYNAR